ncbi:MAG: Na+/H+ antiporter NhaC family protein [Paludibacter sp.]|jgi:NhaC family Na+:H+ antiporter|nr:Na+/H+ antiporter NhaC family protein [Paludibacter sp.]
MSSTSYKLPHPLIALLPVFILIVFVSLSVGIFGADALSGASQMALLLATAVTLLIAKFTVNMHWTAFEKALHKNIKNISTALIILLIIGALSGTWMVSGVVPLFISYGMKLIRPEIFLLSAALISAIVSVITGSSWTTVATIGIALMGIGRAQGFPDGWIAGAIVSGAYFGDKMSPLSDTTVLASSISGTALFTHIRYMWITTIPSMLIALAVFTIAGFSFTGVNTDDIMLYQNALAGRFNMSLWLLLVPAITVFMIAKRYPPLVTLFVSMLLAAVAALIFQKENLLEISGGTTNMDAVKGMMISCFGPTALDTGNAEINSLIATRGMQGMLFTIWLIICATCFGAAMTAGRMIESITVWFTNYITRTGSLVGATVATGLLSNLTMGDQYLSLILSGNLFKELYEKRGYESRLLSRSMEDSITVTSVLIPWNSCGMTQSTVLGVSTLVYFPYAVFNYVSPLMSILIAVTGYKIFRNKPLISPENK